MVRYMLMPEVERKEEKALGELKPYMPMLRDSSSGNLMVMGWMNVSYGP